MKKFLTVLFIFLSSFITSEVFAQCAMCRATVENSISSGENSIGAGLNAGILYLLSAPYLLFIVIGYFWYRSSKSNRKVKPSIKAIV
jgi:hypothetical protein